MYFVLKILKILFTLFRSTCFGHHCVHHQELLKLHMQSLVPINYNNTCCLQICHYVHFIITANYLCDTYRPFFNLYVGFMLVLCCFMLFCFQLWLCGICFLCYPIVTYRVVLGSLCPPVMLCCNYCFFVCLWVGIDFLVP